MRRYSCKQEGKQEDGQNRTKKKTGAKSNQSNVSIMRRKKEVRETKAGESTVLGTNKQDEMWTNTGAIQLLMTRTQTHTDPHSRTQSASSLLLPLTQ